MKNLSILFLLLHFLTGSGQTPSESKRIEKIDKEILSKKVIKKEFFKETSRYGVYERTAVYLRKNIPVLIEKEEKQVKHKYTDHGEFDDVSFFRAKFYIVNWRENQYIRIGTVQNPANKIAAMPEALVFTYDKDEVEQEIKKP